MYRIALVLVLCVGGARVPAAPTLKEQAPVLYHPVTVGDEWVMVIEGDRGPVVGSDTAPLIVTGATTVGGVTTVAVASVAPDGQRFHAYTVEVSGQGVLVVEGSGKK